MVICLPDVFSRVDSPKTWWQERLGSSSVSRRTRPKSYLPRWSCISASYSCCFPRILGTSNRKKSSVINQIIVASFTIIQGWFDFTALFSRDPWFGEGCRSDPFSIHLRHIAISPRANGGNFSTCYSTKNEPCSLTVTSPSTLPETGACFAKLPSYGRWSWPAFSPCQHMSTYVNHIIKYLYL